jgi:uncharacterized protein YbjT (DUF2867 family)
MLKFEQRYIVIVLCDRLEVQVTTDQGSPTFTWPLIGGGKTKFQPIFVGDVAEAIALTIDGKAVPGTTYELGGPQIATLRQIITFILSVIGRKRYLVSLSFVSAASIAFVTEAIAFSEHIAECLLQCAP